MASQEFKFLEITEHIRQLLKPLPALIRQLMDIEDEIECQRWRSRLFRLTETKLPDTELRQKLVSGVLILLLCCKLQQCTQELQKLSLRIQELKTEFARARGRERRRRRPKIERRMSRIRVQAERYLSFRRNQILFLGQPIEDLLQFEPSNQTQLVEFLQAWYQLVRKEKRKKLDYMLPLQFRASSLSAKTEAYNSADGSAQDCSSVVTLDDYVDSDALSENKVSNSGGAEFADTTLKAPGSSGLSPEEKRRLERHLRNMEAVGKVAIARPRYRLQVQVLQHLAREEWLHHTHIRAKIDKRLLARRQPAIVVVIRRITANSRISGGKIAETYLYQHSIRYF